jgi:hypothetical protein
LEHCGPPAFGAPPLGTGGDPDDFGVLVDTDGSGGGGGGLSKLGSGGGGGGGFGGPLIAGGGGGATIGTGTVDLLTSFGLPQVAAHLKASPNLA